MQREIKFRAWDKNRKEMNFKVLVGNTNQNDKNYTCNLLLIGNEWLNADEFCIELMQYTGLKDKNGKEIYEGDILQWCREDIILSSCGYFKGYQLNDKIIVRWLKSGFTLCDITNSSETPSIVSNINNYDFWNMHKFLKVIGNIYENPELLKGE